MMETILGKNPFPGFELRRLFQAEIKKRDGGEGGSRIVLLQADDHAEAARLAILMAGGYQNERDIVRIEHYSYFFQEMPNVVENK